MRPSAALASLPAAIAAATLAAALPAPALAQSSPGRAGQQPVPVDTAYARLVRAYTSDARFLPANVATLPASGTAPTSHRHFGTAVVAPGVMHRSAEVYGRATPRVRVEKVGTSEEGRDTGVMVLQYGARKAPEPEGDAPMLGIPAPARADSARGGGEAGGEYVLPGMVRGQDEIVGRGAIFDVPVARGRVIAFTFDPCTATSTATSSRSCETRS